MAAVATGALPLVAHIPPAGADDFFLDVKTFDYTFQGLDGQPRTCTATGGSGLTRRTGESTFTADSFTTILGEGCAGFTTLSISYRDAAGIARSASTTSASRAGGRAEGPAPQPGPSRF